ncbi:MAG: PIN domain-containing protein [Propionibacteriaceae bacterium]|nr:PIN domain-containing protein [Propionibacteriaceae bacterium]
MDACVLIAHLEPGHPHAQAAAGILDTEEELTIHPLTLAELLVGPMRTHQEQAFRSALTRLGIQTWTPDPDHPDRLARLRATSGLKLPDCCVLDTAQTTQATLATFDHPLAKAATDRGVPIMGLNT